MPMNILLQQDLPTAALLRTLVYLIQNTHIAWLEITVLDFYFQECLEKNSIRKVHDHIIKTLFPFISFCSFLKFFPRAITGGNAIQAYYDA